MVKTDFYLEFFGQIRSNRDSETKGNVTNKRKQRGKTKGRGHRQLKEKRAKIELKQLFFVQGGADISWNTILKFGKFRGWENPPPTTAPQPNIKYTFVWACRPSRIFFFFMHLTKLVAKDISSFYFGHASFVHQIK